jgi:hypothetical protein
MKNMLRVGLALVVMALASFPLAAGEDLPKEAADTLRKACAFFRRNVAAGGGYLWRYSEDLQKREGEGKAFATTAWVQPPGTPSVGLAYLHAYQATGEAYYLEAARETALALVNGQLQSGGWDYRIEFDPAHRKQFAYVVDGRGLKGKNVTTLDDNNTQEAVRFLLRLDQVLQAKDKDARETQQVRTTLDRALDCLLTAQYPNGAWPQRYDAFPDPAKFPVKKASYPATWSRTWPAKDYKSFYTLNDNTLADVIDLMLEAGATRKEPTFTQAALKGGDFLLLAQMPDPQPIWAQQYDADMHPAWARKFEPPSVTGGESQGALRMLLRLYRETGDKKYLEPVPRALDYLRKVPLPDGRLARFYELQTSKPLFFTKDYKLTYSDADLPTHYGFKISSDGLNRLAKDYETLKKQGPPKSKRPAEKPTVTEGLKNDVKKIIAALDDRGRWVEEGKLRAQGPDDTTQRIISCQTFIKNVNTLSTYLRGQKR